MYILKNTITGEIYKNRQTILNSSTFNIKDLEATWPEGWDTIDWTQEPSESLEELHRQRALQLRESYDYLILYYSGGSDSSTVLNIFKKYNIPLDEVVVGRFIDHDLLKLPYVKPNYGNKITNINMTRDFLYDFHSQQKWLKDGFGYSGLMHTLSRNEVYFFEKHNLIKTTVRKGTVAHIYGVDKPLIKMVDNKYYCTLSSNTVNFNIHNQYEYKENFFTSENFPKLHAKQCHIIMNWWKIEYPKSTRAISESSYVESRQVMNDLLRYSYDSRNDAGDSSAGGFLNSVTNLSSENGKLINLYKRDKLYDTYVNGLIKEYFTTDNAKLIMNRGIAGKNTGKENKISKSNDLKIIIKELEKRFYLGDMVNDQ